MNKVEKYIEENQKKCIRNCPDDNGTLIGLPQPYTVPAVGCFEEMYYWDTYFTNIGLIVSGQAEQAKNNTDNLISLLNRFGFVPNGNRTYYLKNSQPPFLSEMVCDVYKCYRDKEWLTHSYDALKLEYRFWTEKRNTPIQLSRYGYVVPQGEIKVLADAFYKRTGFMPESERDAANHVVACCESGWDITPRWGTHGFEFVSADLNSLLYLFEKNMKYFSVEIQNGDEELWGKRACERRRLMMKYMTDENGLFMDYNFVKGCHSRIFSVAALYPLFAGLATKEQAKCVVENIGRLEMRYGIAVCEKNSKPGKMQWNYPNGWACLQFIAVRALQNYGYYQDARRIAQKYIKLVDSVFEKTENLWEKYNVVTGDVNVASEYDTPPMMGWSAGVYTALKQDTMLDELQGNMTGEEKIGQLM